VQRNNTTGTQWGRFFFVGILHGVSTIKGGALESVQRDAETFEKTRDLGH
jgi:hypothetical protein